MSATPLHIYAFSEVVLKTQLKVNKMIKNLHNVELSTVT